MATEPVSDITPPLRPSPIPKSSAEYITLLAHFYRGEKVRMDQWRNRIDVTSNWSFLIVGGLVSIALTTPAAGHGIMLLAMLLVTLVLNIEARRYRFFDAYRSRVRFLERNWHAQVFAPEPDANPDWLRELAADLRNPTFRLTWQQALSRRLRRHYGWMYCVLLLAWLLKTSSKEQSINGTLQMVHSIDEWIGQCQLAAVPGPVVLGLVAAFYGSLVFVGWRYSAHEKEDGGVYL
jgi:uncharacterized membrane protein